MKNNTPKVHIDSSTFEARAILDGKKTIKAYRITTMPKPDRVEDKDGNIVKQ